MIMYIVSDADPRVGEHNVVPMCPRRRVSAAPPARRRLGAHAHTHARTR